MIKKKGAQVYWAQPEYVKGGHLFVFGCLDLKQPHINCIN